MKKCPKCGTILDDSKKKCYMCGAEFGASSNHFGDTFDQQIGANVSTQQDNALFSEPEVLDMPGEVTNNNGAFFSNSSSSKSNLFDEDINKLNSMEYDNRNEIQKSVDSIFEKKSFKSKEEANKGNEEKERQQHEKEIRKQREKDRQAEAKAQKAKERQEKQQEAELKKEMQKQEKLAKEQEKQAQLKIQEEAKAKQRAEQEALKQQQLANQAAAKAQADAERAEQEALKQEKLRIEREQQKLQQEQALKEQEKQAALQAEAKRLERERKQFEQAAQMKQKRESSYKKTNNTYFNNNPSNTQQPQINWGNSLGNNNDAMDFEDKVSKPKTSINMTMIFNILSVLFLVGTLIFVYVKFLKPESNKNVNLGGLIYSVDDEFKLSNEDGSTKYYTYGKSCALRITYGSANDNGSFIDNYLEDIKNQYSSNESNLTSKSSMELNGNTWYELSIRKIDAGGTEKSPIKYNYVSIVYKGNFYHTVFVNPDSDKDCQKMYEDFIKTMKFE